MKYIEGEQIKQLLNKTPKNKRQHLCREIGKSIGMLHKRGIIHGDLTTSNIILHPGGKIFFLDFGLGDRSNELEARGVDLHLMKRALQSTHFQFAAECFDSVLDGYRTAFDTETLEKVLGKIKEIERRGRYVAERKEND
jgi:TP53 regulating kinase-like protein